MFGDQLSETVYVQPMDYNRRTSSPTSPPQNNMQCVWVGLAAIVIVHLMIEQNRTRRPWHPVFQPVQNLTGMITNVVKGVSAKVTGKLDDIPMVDACKVFPKFKCGMASLIDNTANLANPKDPTPDAVKRKNHKTLLNVVNDSKQERACIIIFAHWCPHCHNLINEVVEKANSSPKNGLKYVLVNGDSVHSDAFQGDDAIISLQHYPTILCKVGNMGKEVKTLEEAVTLALETNPEDIADTTNGEQGGEGENGDEEEVNEDPLRMLF